MRRAPPLGPFYGIPKASEQGVRGGEPRTIGLGLWSGEGHCAHGAAIFSCMRSEARASRWSMWGGGPPRHRSRSDSTHQRMCGDDLCLLACACGAVVLWTPERTHEKVFAQSESVRGCASGGEVKSKCDETEDAPCTRARAAHAAAAARAHTSQLVRMRRKNCCATWVSSKTRPTSYCASTQAPATAKASIVLPHSSHRSQMPPSSMRRQLRCAAMRPSPKQCGCKQPYSQPTQHSRVSCREGSVEFPISALHLPR